MQRPEPLDAETEKVFVELVETCQLPLLRMCILQLRDQEMAKDAVQETFMKAYRAMPDFRWESNARTWLTRIAINTCRDMQRSWWHRCINRSIIPEELPLVSEGVSDDAIAVAQAIAKLPPKLKEAVLLYYYQNMQMDEIAEVLGIHISSVSGRLKRARNRLRAELKGVLWDD